MCRRSSSGWPSSIGRGVRYFGQGYLAVLYGERAVDLIRAHGTEAGIALAALALLVGVVFYLIRRQLQTSPPS